MSSQPPHPQSPSTKPDSSAPDFSTAVTETDWHALPPEEAARRLNANQEEGLAETEVTKRLELHGPNKLAEKPPTPPFLVFLEQFKGLLVLLLIGAAVLAAMIGHVVDGVVIMAVTVINAVLGFYQEYRAEQSLAALKRMLTLRPRVRRGGQVVEVDSVELVPGDIMLLETGDRIAADGRILERHSLEIDESALTGESMPVVKWSEPLDDPETPMAERVNMAYMNTVVTRGRGWMVVTETGANTVTGRLAKALSEEEEGDTPLQIQLDHLGKRLSLVAVIIVGLIGVLGFIKGTALADVIIQGIALAVAAIPEGLPAVVTVTLALGMRRMVRFRAIIKRLVAVETLGCTTVICSDKTGTLTLNQMTAKQGFFMGRRFTVGGEGYQPEGAIEMEGGANPRDWSPLLLPLALCNDSTITDGELSGDPTEGALLTLAYKGGAIREEALAKTPRIAEIPFDSANQYMATFHQGAGGEAGGEMRMHVKGSPEEVLRRSTHWVSAEGVKPLDDATRDKLMAENNHLAEQGMRVLGVAWKTLPAKGFDVHDDLEKHAGGLTLTGLVGLIDPPRPEAREAIALCHKAGIVVKMITGDQKDTATAIARQLGLRRRVMTGAELDDIEAHKLAEEIERIDVFARATPEHKVMIIRALKSNDHVVAMTGDGVNDAPALKSADIGVAMGISGTEVAKEAASMVLTDDNFATIVKAVREGRGLYDNLVKFVRFQLSTNLGAIFTVLTALLMEFPEPFNPIQILWINIIMDGPPAMSLGVDKVDSNVMNRPPRPTVDRILKTGRLLRLTFFGLLMMVGSLGTMLWVMEVDPGNTARASTLAFTTFVLFQLFNAFNARSETTTAFNRDIFTNRALWLSLLGAATLQVLAINLQPVREIFHTVPLSLSDWGIAVSVAASILVLEELRKVATRVGVVMIGGEEKVPAEEVA